MTEATRYSTLRDYLALLRRQRLLLVAIVVAFTGAGLGYSLSQTPSYQAEAAISFRDVSEDLRLFGVNVSSGENPLTLAAAEAESVTTLRAARRVQNRLDTEISPEALRSAVNAQVSFETGNTVVQATWDDPEFAARLANTFAEVTVATSRREVVDRVDSMIEELRPQARGEFEPGEAFENFEKSLARQNLFQLEQVRHAVDPAEVSRQAEVPASPDSPATARNTIIGGLLGIAFGLLAAFVRDSLDRRLRTAKDAHDELGCPVLARVGDKALGSAGLASNGNGGYVRPADLEAFRILRTNMAILETDPPPRSVLVTSGLPEEGKSTVAASLASAAAAAGQSTLLVEADLRKPVLAKRIGLEAGPGLADYLAGDAEPQDILQTVSLPAQTRSANGGPGSVQDSVEHRTLVCITAGAIPDQPAELLAAPRCAEFIGKVSRAYDLVVFDSSPLLSTADPLELMPHMDSVLICVRLAASTRDETRAVGSAISLLPERPTGLVVTGLGASDGYYGDYAYYG